MACNLLAFLPDHIAKQDIVDIAILRILLQRHMTHICMCWAVYNANIEQARFCTQYMNMSDLLVDQVAIGDSVHKAVDQHRTSAAAAACWRISSWSKCLRE